MSRFLPSSAAGWLVTCAALLFGTAACLEPIAPGDVEIGVVVVTIGSKAAAADTIQVRSTTRARAIAFAREGYDAGISRFDFESSDTLIATVDSLGTIRGIAPGKATITATVAGGPSGTASVVVLPSTIAYSIEVGRAPGAIAFSTDFARAYVATAPDSLVMLDALGFFRISAVGLDYAIDDLAATSTHIFATHAAMDSVSVLSTGTNAIMGRIWVGAGPVGVVASGQRAFVAARWDRKVVTIDDGVPGLAVPVGGEPTQLAISGDGARVYAGVLRGAEWQLVLIDPQFPDTVSSVALAAEPKAITTDLDGARVWVLLANGTAEAFRVGTAGEFTRAGAALVGTGATGIAARPVGPPFVIVSGTPARVFHGESMTLLEEITGAGTGLVTMRPDGFFAFVSEPATGVIHVIRM